MIDVGILRMVPITDITYNQQSAHRDYFGDIDGLMESILKEGLINPLTVRSDDGNPPYTLLSGHRRMTACIRLQMPVIPVRIYDRPLSDLEYLMIQYAENKRRQALSYTEEDAMIKRMLSLGAENGDEISNRELARRLGISPSKVDQHVRRATEAELVPQLKESKNALQFDKTARNIRNTVTNRLVAENAPVAIRSESNRNRPIYERIITSYKLGDFFENDLDDGQFQFIECDPPYGLDIESMRESEDKSLFTGYREINPVNYPLFLKELCTECYRLGAIHAWMILWFKPENYQICFSALKDAGWNPRFTPVIWKKGTNPGQVRASSENLAHSYEPFLYASKGDPHLITPGRSNIFDVPTVRTERIHPTERPVELMRSILLSFRDPNGNVLVPFAGSGVTLRVAGVMNATAVGYDLSEHYRNAFIRRILEDPNLRGVPQNGEQSILVPDISH